MVIRCKSEGCGQFVAENSSYCPLHKVEARKKWLARIREGAAVKENRDKEFVALHAKADAAGRAAVDALQVVPMVVQEHANMANDNSPVAKSYYVPDGVCGFASIIITPGNCPFANWAKKHLNAGKHYHGGVSIWVHDYNQSYQKKTAYAHAYGKVLAEAGIKGYVDSRLD